MGEAFVNHRIAIVLAASAVWLAAVGTCAAQDYRPPQAVYSGLPPYEIATIVRSLGLDPISRPVRQGAVYVLRALDEYDREMRVVVDARSGRVTSAVPVVPAGAWHEGPGMSDARVAPYERAAPPAPASSDAVDDEGLPPLDGPGPRVIRAPRDLDRAAAVVPARTPIPRPRPDLPASAPDTAKTSGIPGNADDTPVNGLW
jgi:hypothetical protein